MSAFGGVTQIEEWDDGYPSSSNLSDLGRDDDTPRRDWLFNLYRALDAEDGSTAAPERS